MNLDNLQVDGVFSFKLNSGEELVTKVKQIEKDYIVIEEPVSIAPGPQGMGLVPSLFTANPRGETRLNNTSVAIVSATDEAVKMKYLEATTGLKVPDKKILVG